MYDIISSLRSRKSTLCLSHCSVFHIFFIFLLVESVLTSLVTHCPENGPFSKIICITSPLKSEPGLAFACARRFAFHRREYPRIWLRMEDFPAVKSRIGQIQLIDRRLDMWMIWIILTDLMLTLKKTTMMANKVEYYIKDRCIFRLEQVDSSIEKAAF